jgi:hypothetical protein
MPPFGEKKISGSARAGTAWTMKRETRSPASDLLMRRRLIAEGPR